MRQCLNFRVNGFMWLSHLRQQLWWPSPPPKKKCFQQFDSSPRTLSSISRGEIESDNRGRRWTSQRCVIRTWEAAPVGQMWLVRRPGLPAPLGVRPFIWGDSRRLLRCFCEAPSWWRVGKHSSRRLNKHDPVMAHRDSCTYFKALAVKRGIEGVWGGWRGSRRGWDPHRRTSVRCEKQVMKHSGKSQHSVLF